MYVRAIMMGAVGSVLFCAPPMKWNVSQRSDFHSEMENTLSINLYRGGTSSCPSKLGTDD